MKKSIALILCLLLVLPVLFCGCGAQEVDPVKELVGKWKGTIDMTAYLNKMAGEDADMAEMFDNTYVINLRKYSPVYDSEFKKKFFVGGHMNAAGYILTAQMITSYIDYIVRHNLEDFSQVGFIGTPHKFLEVVKKEENAQNGEQ